MDNKKLFFIILLVLIIFAVFSNITSKYFISKQLETINKLYGPESFIKVDNKSLGNQYNLTYGELTGPGMEQIVKYLKSKNICPSSKTFIDLGCGNGKTLAYGLVYGFKQAYGAEIVEARYSFAERKRSQLEERMRERVQLTKSDIFNLPKNYFPAGSVVFVSNLLFPEETNQKLINFLSEVTPADVIIIVSKIPNNLYKLKLIEKIDVPMSWASNSKCYVLGHQSNK